MTRHITDHPKPVKNGKRTAAFMRIRRIKSGQSTHSKTLERPRPVGKGRFIQYLEIERGRRV